jgi:hypothetical protein
LSLIVAKKIGKQVFFIGDTKFSYRDPLTNKERFYTEAEKYIGGLKVILLTPGLCVAFAGDVDTARQAIEGVYEKDVNLFDKNQAIEYFLKSHLESLKSGSPEHVTDYIVGTICSLESNSADYVEEIFKISDGTVTWDSPVAWIGDSSAFGRYQSSFQTSARTVEKGRAEFEIISFGKELSSELAESVSKNMRVFQEVITDPASCTVDGLRTLVFSTQGGFRYREYVLFNGIPRPVLPGGVGSPINFGGAAEGTNAMHVGLMTGEGHAVFPVYYYSGRFGIVYNPTISFDPIKLVNIDIEDFKRAVNEQINAQHCRALAYQDRILLRT